MRRWRISKKDVDKYGPTPECNGCRTVKAGLPQHNHSEACRARMENFLQYQEPKTSIDWLKQFIGESSLRSCLNK